MRRIMRRGKVYKSKECISMSPRRPPYTYDIVDRQHGKAFVHAITHSQTTLSALKYIFTYSHSHFSVPKHYTLTRLIYCEFHFFARPCDTYNGCKPKKSVLKKIIDVKFGESE